MKKDFCNHNHEHEDNKPGRVAARRPAPFPNQNAMTTVEHPKNWLAADDLCWFNEGAYWRLYQILGACLAKQYGGSGTPSAVWATNAGRVCVFGNFSGTWQGNFGGIETEPLPRHKLSHSLTVTLPPLGALAFKPHTGDAA